MLNLWVLTHYPVNVIPDSDDDGLCLQFDIFQVILMNGNAMNQTEQAQNAGVEESWKTHASCVLFATVQQYLWKGISKHYLNFILKCKNKKRMFF